MKKDTIKNKTLSGVASVAKKSSSFFANTLCTWWDYQPKMPKSVKKMRKF
ncbi:MAG: cyclic lactone autoinducer peptide [Clostridium sp.]|nr:cyclic lactone autoinducer peptide [Clostridium sp.]